MPPTYRTGQGMRPPPDAGQGMRPSPDAGQGMDVPLLTRTGLACWALPVLGVKVVHPIFLTSRPEHSRHPVIFPYQT